MQITRPYSVLSFSQPHNTRWALVSNWQHNVTMGAKWIIQEVRMAKRLKDLKELKIERPPRVKLSAKESLKRTQEFDKRKERFIAAIRKSKG
jgi:hypothetical protein